MSLIIVLGVIHFIDPPKRHLVVFCNPGFVNEWERLSPDFLLVPKDWRDLDTFLKVVKDQGWDHIDIDIDCHGNDYLWLIDEDGNEYIASMGFIVNHIEKYLVGKDIKVFCEACFAGKVYKTSIRGNKIERFPVIREFLKRERGNKIEDCNHIPKFPIYGIRSNTTNIGNSIYLQYRSDCNLYMEDLRDFEKKKLLGEGLIQKDYDELTLDQIWQTLYIFGN